MEYCASRFSREKNECMNQPVVVREPSAEQIQPNTAWAMAVQSWAQTAVIQNDVQATDVGNQIGTLKKAQDDAKAFRETFTKPLYEVIRRIEKGFRPFLKASEAAIDELGLRMLEYRARVDAQKAAALPLAARLAETIVTFEDAQQYRHVVAQGSVVVEKRVGAVVFAEKWRARIVEPRAIPAGVMVDGQWLLLWKVDEEALQRLAGPTAPAIPGVVFERFEDISQVRRS